MLNKILSRSISYENATSIYDNEIQINGLDGTPINLDSFKGKKLLIVNVASKCGFTHQYKNLQELYSEHKDKLTILGVPCNQFGGQEPGSSEQIQSFCDTNYGIEFPMTEKVDVKGENQHPLFDWLTDQSKNGVKKSKVIWNFEKFLLDENGRLLDSFKSMTRPQSDKIVSRL